MVRDRSGRLLVLDLLSSMIEAGFGFDPARLHRLRQLSHPSRPCGL